MHYTLGRRLSKITATVLAAAMLFTAVPAAAFAAMPTALSGDFLVTKEIENNEISVDLALAAIRTARQTGDAKDVATAKALIDRLSPTNRIRLYVALNRLYYLNNYLDNGKIYFDAMKYLEANPDVMAMALSEGVSDVYAYAINHYLNAGIYEARPSQTPFDPIVAILAYPETFTDILFSPQYDPQEIHDRFAIHTGKVSTSEYDVYWTAPAKDDGTIPAEPLSHSLHIKRPWETGDTTNGPSKVDEENRGSGKHNKAEVTPTPTEEPEDEEPTPEPTDEPTTTPSPTATPTAKPTAWPTLDPSTLPTPTPIATPTERNRRTEYINQQAKEVTPKKDLANNAAISSLKNSNKISDKYTLMIYMSGDNQEPDENYRRVSMQIASMMKSALDSNQNLDDINVILCVGGSNSYANEFLNNGQTSLQAGIYYLNFGGLNAAAKTALNNFDIFNNKPSEVDFNEIINANTLTKIGKADAADMGDPKLLAGFINMCTDNFPASDYGLILSGHGGGVEGGMAPSATLEDENGNAVLDKDGKKVLEGTSLTTDELEAALMATTLYKMDGMTNGKTADNDGKLGLLMFDGCLMGSTEVAFNLKDNYRYMVASEEVTVSYTDYSKILKTITKYVKDAYASGGDKKPDDYLISTEIAQVYEDSTSVHQGMSDGKIGGMSTFSSVEMHAAVKNLNVLGAELSKFLKKDDGAQAQSDNTELSSIKPEVRDKVFMAIRTAVLECYTASTVEELNNIGEIVEKNKYVDIGQFLYILYGKLSEINNYDRNDPDYKQVRDLEKTVKDFFENRGFLQGSSVVYTYGGYGSMLYYKPNGFSVGNTINFAEASEGYGTYGIDNWMEMYDSFYVDYFKNYTNFIYGSSLYIPFGGTLEEFKNSDYYKYYKTKAGSTKPSELEEYVQFIENYLNYYNDPNGYGGKIEALKEEIDVNDLSSALLKPRKVKEKEYIDSYDEYCENTDIDAVGSYIHRNISSDKDDIFYVDFEIPTSYEMAGIAAPEHTTGNPMLDILETKNSIEISAVRKQTIATKDKKSYTTVDMICAEAPISQYSFSLYGNHIVYNLTDLMSNVQGLALEGMACREEDCIPMNGGDGEPVIDWQFVLKSNLEDAQNSQYKTDAVKAVMTADEKADEFFIDKYLTISGGARVANIDPAFVSKDDLYHVFVKGDNGNYTYMGTVEQQVTETEGNTSAITYGKVDATAISAYHYIIVEEEVPGQNAGDTNKATQMIKKCLEKMEGVNQGYYAVGDSGNEDYHLTISSVMVGDKVSIPVGESGETAEVMQNFNTGFVLNIDGANDYSQIANAPDYYNNADNLGDGHATISDGYHLTEITPVGESGTNPAEYDDQKLTGEDTKEVINYDIERTDEGEADSADYGILNSTEAPSAPEDDRLPSADPGMPESTLPNPLAGEAGGDDAEQMPEIPELPETGSESSEPEIPVSDTGTSDAPSDDSSTEPEPEDSGDDASSDSTDSSSDESDAE